MKLAPLLFGLLTTAGCMTSREEAPAGNASATAALAQGLMEAWESGDADRIDALFAEDATYDDIPNDRTFRGREGAKQYVGHVHSWASDLEIEVLAVHASEAAATVEWVMKGTQARPIGEGFPLATGRSFELRGATLIEVEAGEIVRAADYMDVATFLGQLGVRFELPE